MNPYLAAEKQTLTPSIYLDEKFQHKFQEIVDAIRQGNKEYLRSHVTKPDMGGPVNLSEDPLFNVLIASKKSDLAIELLEAIPKDDKVLLKANYVGDTALHVAAREGNVKMAKALINKNKDLLHARNKQRESPLHKAALYGKRDIFVLLEEEGGDQHALREDGATVLHCAIMGNAPKLALEIASNHSDLMTTRNSRGVTPLQLMVTIPDAFRSKLYLGSIDYLIYKCIPLEDSIVAHRTDADDEEKQATNDNSKTSLSISVAAKWINLLLFRILKHLFAGVKVLEQKKINHNEAMELVAYLARDPGYWDFIVKGRTAPIQEGSTHPSPSDPDSDSPPNMPPQSDSLLTVPPQSDFPPNVAPQSDSPPIMTPQSDSPPNTAPQSDSPPIMMPQSDSPPNTTPQSDSPPIMMPQSDSPPNTTPLSDSPLDTMQTQNELGFRIDDKKDLDDINRWDQSPLTLGAKMGLHDFVQKILTVCPQSAMYLDPEGRNILQVAIQNGQENILEIVESKVTGSNPLLPSWLLSSIDAKTKNTILHFAAEKTVKEDASALQLQTELQWFERVKNLVPKDLEYSRNEKEKTAQELFTEKHTNMVKEGKSQLMEMGKTCSSLVAAVVFASSFSIPGDKDEKHNPVFYHKIAFKVFSHAYVIGLSCASTALVLFLSFLTSPYREQDFRRSLPTKYFFANVSFFLALLALLVAFSCNIFLNIYGGRKAETNEIVPLVCELTIFPAVCCLVLLYRGSTFGLVEFLRHVWR